MTQSAPRPLDGITVVSLEHAIAAPFCTRQLADLGARVIKIERPGSGDFARGYDQRVAGLASHFVWTNRSKQSLTLDLKQAEADGILHGLLAKADVLVQNLAPGAAARMGLSFEALHARYPRLIVCDISGYGEGGPYEKKKAYDLLIQSEGGFLSVTGGPGEEQMAKAGCSVADIAAGMYAYTGVLSALLLRDRTGVGSRIDVSMLESLVEWMGYPMYYAYDGAPPPPRAGASHSTIYPYGPFPTGGGGTTSANGRCSASRCCSTRRWPATRASRPTSAVPSIVRCCARSSSMASPRCRWTRWWRAWRRRRSPMPGSTTCTACGSTRSWRPATAGRQSVRCAAVAAAARAQQRLHAAHGPGAGPGRAQCGDSRRAGVLPR